MAITSAPAFTTPRAWPWILAVPPILGLPLNEPVMLVAALMATLALATGTRRMGGRRIAVGLALVAVAGLLHLYFPRTQIAEGHNIFVTKATDEPLAQALPPPVHRVLDKKFEATFPATKRCDPAINGCWLNYSVPQKAFAFAADAIWRLSAMSRTVRGIDVTTPENLRASFLNDKAYDWYDHASDLTRRRAPFYVAYDLNADLVGSQLCWRGDLIWDQTWIPHPDLKCYRLQPRDIGARIWGLSFPDANSATGRDLTLKLEKSARLKILDAGYDALRLALLLGLVLVTTRLRTALIFPLALAGGMLVLTAPLLLTVPIYAGGDDGLTHQGYARIMTLALLQGDLMGLLRGVEDVFYIMPGLRYFLVGERLLFGDMPYLAPLTLAAMPLVIGWIAGLLWQSRRGGWAAGAGFLLLALIDHAATQKLLGAWGFSLREYIWWTERGFPDVAGYLAFLLGLGGVITGLAAKRRAALGWAGLALALAVFLRPNLAPAAALLLAGVAGMLGWTRRWRDMLTLGLGFAPLLLVPLHNLVFGQRLVLLTSAALIKENLFVLPRDYLDAASAFLRGEPSPLIGKTTWHLQEWLADSNAPHRFSRSVARLALLPPLMAALMVGSWRLKLAGLVCLGLQAPLFFYNPTGRYVLLAWLLTALVAIAVIYEQRGLLKWPRRFHSVRKGKPS